MLGFALERIDLVTPQLFTQPQFITQWACGGLQAEHWMHMQELVVVPCNTATEVCQAQIWWACMDVVATVCMQQLWPPASALQCCCKAPQQVLLSRLPEVELTTPRIHTMTAGCISLLA